MRAEIEPGDDAGLAQPAARRHPAGNGAAALDDDDAGLRRTLEGGALRRGRAAGREPGRDEALRPAGDRGVDQGAVRAGVGIEDVDARQRRSQIESRKRRRRHMGAERRPVEMDAVAVDMPERAEIGRAEGLQPVGGGLDHVAGGVDLVVQDDRHALAARLGGAGDAQRGDEVHPGIAADGARRTLRADQDDRLRRAQGQVEKKRGLLEGRGAVRDHEAGRRRLGVGDAVDRRAQREPISRADLGAGDPGAR